MSVGSGASYSGVDIASVMKRNNRDNKERSREAPRRRSYAPDKGYGHFGAGRFSTGSAKEAVRPRKRPGRATVLSS